MGLAPGSFAKRPAAARQELHRHSDTRMGAPLTSRRVRPQLQPIVVVWLIACAPTEMKQVTDVSVEMIEAFTRQFGIVARLGQDEAALDDGLGVPRQAFGCPVAGNAVLAPRRLDIGLQRGGMAENAVPAGIANVGGGRIDLLRHGADQAGELGQVAHDDRLAEGHISENALQGIRRGVIGRDLKEAGGRLLPEFRRGDAERFLAAEMMEEGPLGDIGRAADVIDGGGGEALGADDVPRRLQEAVSGMATFGRLLGGS